MRQFLPFLGLLTMALFLQACGDDVQTCSLSSNPNVVLDGNLALDSNCQAGGDLERFEDPNFNGQIGDGGETCDFRTGEGCDE